MPFMSLSRKYLSTSTNSSVVVGAFMLAFSSHSGFIHSILSTRLEGLSLFVGNTYILPSGAVSAVFSTVSVSSISLTAGAISST